MINLIKKRLIRIAEDNSKYDECLNERKQWVLEQQTIHDCRPYVGVLSEDGDNKYSTVVTIDLDDLANATDIGFTGLTTENKRKLGKDLMNYMVSKKDEIGALAFNEIETSYKYKATVSARAFEDHISFKIELEK